MKKLLLSFIVLGMGISIIPQAASALAYKSLALYHQVIISPGHPYDNFSEVCSFHTTAGVNLGAGIATEWTTSPYSTTFAVIQSPTTRWFTWRGPTGNLTLRNIMGPPNCPLSKKILYYYCWSVPKN